MSDLTPPLKWHGGKSYLADKIIGLMPPRCKNPNAPDKDDLGYLHFCEPYFGGGAVLLANDPSGISEVENDINGQLSLFWRVLQSETLFPKFHRIIEAMPFSQYEYQTSVDLLKQAPDYHPDGVIESAAFFCQCRQSLAGRMKSFAPLSRNRTRRGMNEQASAWLNAIEGLPAVHARLKRVAILCDDAVKVILSQDGPRTLYYLDPPYASDTRASPDVYQHEMTTDQHHELLSTLANIKGRFLLSGYRNDLYDKHAELNQWRRVDFEIDNKASGGSEKRTMVESVWVNY